MDLVSDWLKYQFCGRDMIMASHAKSHEVPQVKLRVTCCRANFAEISCCASEKVPAAPKRMCRCNMSLKYVPATFSEVCQLSLRFGPCYMSLLHSPATCPLSVYLTRFCPRYILEQHVRATCPLVWTHLKEDNQGYNSV